MSRERFQSIMATLTLEQEAAMRVVVLTERRLRTHYQSGPNHEGPMALAQAWALDRVPEPA